MGRQRKAHREQPLLARHREHGVVAVRPTRGGVDEEVDVVVDGRYGRRLREHDVEVLPAEDLLQRVEGEAGQLALDEVGAVLHDGLELEVAVGALPAGDEVQHVDALGALADGLALGAGQLDAEEGEDGLMGDWVAHLHEPGVEVDLAEEGADAEEGGVADAEERGDGLLSDEDGSDGDAEFELLAWDQGEGPT